MLPLAFAHVALALNNVPFSPSQCVKAAFSGVPDFPHQSDVGNYKLERYKSDVLAPFEHPMHVEQTFHVKLHVPNNPTSGTYPALRSDCRDVAIALRLADAG